MASVDLQLDCDLASINDAAAKVVELLKSYLSDIEQLKIQSAIQEMLRNALEHGNLGVGYYEKVELCEQGIFDEEIERRAAEAKRQGKKISLQAAVNEDIFECTVTDEGDGFIWEVVPHPMQHLLQPSGRGLLIIKTVFDTIEFNEAGNSVTVTKRLT